MDKKRVDVAILGGGPGGYPAAIRLAQAGKKVALIEKDKVGGVCLHCGCIPTKALLSNAHLFQKMKKSEQYGIHVEGSISCNWDYMVQKKDEVVQGLYKSLESVISSYGVEKILSEGKLLSDHELEVSGMKVIADHIIIATGSTPKNIPAFPFDGEVIHSSTTLLNIKKLPESIVIVGAGAIGCEFASLFNDLGVKVFLVEALPRILPLESEAASMLIRATFQKRGMEIFTEQKVKTIEKREKGCHVVLEGGKTLDASCALISIGRTLNSQGIGLENTEVKTDRGMIVVDEKMQTNVPTIWAIGDVTGKLMYAHVATHQGLIAAENILGNERFMEYDAVPGITFTRPEVASCGLSKEKAKEKGYEISVGTYPLRSLGRAQASQETEGFVEVIIDKETGRILGAQVVGDEAENLIALMATAIHNEIPIECIADTIIAHPTLQEGWLEAALQLENKPLHMLKR